jgi:hypothetical protein
MVFLETATIVWGTLVLYQILMLMREWQVEHARNERCRMTISGKPRNHGDRSLQGKWREGEEKARRMRSRSEEEEDGEDAFF